MFKKDKSLLLFALLFFLCYLVYGQKTEQQVIDDLHQLHLENFSKRDDLMKLINEYGKLDQTHEVYLKIDSVYNIYDSIEIEDLKLDFDYAFSHPYSMKAFRKVKFQIKRQPGMRFYDEFKKLYELIPDEIKNSEEGIEMKEQLQYFDQSRPGSSAPNIYGIDFSGNEFDLHKLNEGHLLIVDFWASWCSPCVRDLPFYKELILNFPEKKIRILSISIDDDPDKWRNAIKKYELNNTGWYHYSTLENKSTAQTDYFVAGIPHTILIGEDGIIIGKFKGSGEKNKANILKLIEGTSMDE